MNKTIIIDGKTVNLKTTAATPLLYKRSFGVGLLTDIVGIIPKHIDLNSVNADNLTLEDVKSFDYEVMARIVWIFVKTYDKSTPDLYEWLDEFEEFPMIEIFQEITPLLQCVIGTPQTAKNLETPKKVGI